MIGNRYGNGEPPTPFGISPSGPKLAVARLGDPKTGTASMNVGRAVALSSSSLWPSHAAVDYAHKLTTTTVLLVGLVAFLLLGPRTTRGKLKAIGRRHVGGS